MIKVLKNRRGVAIESAITFMVIIFAMITIIGTVVAISALDRRSADSEFENSVVVEKIGEAFVSNPGGFTEETEQNGYSITKSGDSTSGYTLKVKKGEKTVLVITTNAKGKVIRWSNYDKDNQE